MSREADGLSQDVDGEGSRTPSRSSTSTPDARKAPLGQQAGNVAVPAGQGRAEPHDKPSIRHDLNSAHIKKDDISRTSSPGMGTSNASNEDGPPNWMVQEDILSAASHGQAPPGKESHADVEQLRKEQHPASQGGEQSGPTGLSIGKRQGADPGRTKHDEQQQDLLDGKPSRDGEGSAGLPFDAGN